MNHDDLVKNQETARHAFRVGVFLAVLIFLGVLYTSPFIAVGFLAAIGLFVRAVLKLLFGA